MVITQEVEDSMDEEQGHFLLQGHAPLQGLVRGPLRRYDYIPQDSGIQMPVFSFPHGEGEDVCRTVSGKIFSIEVAHLIIVDQEDTQLTLVTPQVA